MTVETMGKCMPRSRSWMAILSLANAAMVWLSNGPMIQAATPPTITGMPTVNATTLVADDTTPYTVSMIISDKDGYNDIRCTRILFGYTESGGDQAQGRGYMNWGKSDADVTQWGGNWVIGDATGGGRWAYRTDAWGGIIYMTPLSCETTVSGKASGGSGSRTVIWTFTVKSAWAFNPVMNDADGWAADGVIGGTSYVIGWIDSPESFDVVSAPCTTYCTTPRPPVVSNPSDHTIELAIYPNDPSTYIYTIMISPNVGGRMFVQADGSLGTNPRWASKSAWSTKRVTGMLPNTMYTATVRASRSETGYCPSAWSPSAQVTTLGGTPIINPHGGIPLSPWVRGQCPYRQITVPDYEMLWDVTIGSMGRGLAGGLDADTYDWRDITSGSNWGLGGGAFTTLQFLQYARDHQTVPLMTANALGGGYRDTVDGTFHCQSINPDGLAADWVRYTNFILQNYRQGQENNLAGEDLRIYNAISNWGDRPKLLAPEEQAVPRIQYWEIGNEPELDSFPTFLDGHYLSPTDYRDRYKLICNAMKAVDPTLKFGPCLMVPSDPNSGSGLWLAALAADQSTQIDFVGYHPYYGSIKAGWGYYEGMTSALRDCKAYLNSKSAGIRAILNQNGRSACGLIASEWNPVNWDAPGYMQSSMANGIGATETCFTFAEDGILASTFWEQPQQKTAVNGAYAGMVSHMGNVLVTTSAEMGYDPNNCNFRIYVTKYSGNDNTIMIWGMNFDDIQPVTISMGLTQSRIMSAILKHYGKPGDDTSGGDTSLTTSSGLAWDEQDITAGFNTVSFPFTMEDAEITLLILQIVPTSSLDHDRDGDIDQSDFGWFQECLSGGGYVQANPLCSEALIDADSDVDENDLSVFLGCMSGQNIPPDPGCINQ